MTEQGIEASGELTPLDRDDLAAALRELREKIETSTEKQSEIVMRLGYSATTLSTAATDTVSSARLLGIERKKLSEIVARPAPLWRQRVQIAGALVIGLVTGLVGPTILGWISSLLN